jgi:hypothetical protein
MKSMQDKLILIEKKQERILKDIKNHLRIETSFEVLNQPYDSLRILVCDYDIKD